MFPMFAKIVTILAAVVSTTNAQITYLTPDEIAASATTPVWSGSASAVGEGNGVYLSPDGALAVVVSTDATVKAFNSLDGTVVWTFPAPTTTATSLGGAFFCYASTTPFVLYSYVDADVR
jgi:hypothetical protein